MARWIEIWLKPDLERQQLGFLPHKDLQGMKPLEFFFEKKTYIYQVHLLIALHMASTP
jgi:hypothetical protein